MSIIDKNNSLFKLDLPECLTNKDLEKVQKIYSNLDPYFIASGCIRKRKEWFEKLWEKFQTYADNHFLTQIKTNFHQRTWEMYIGNVLLDKRLNIQSKNEGPDFMVDKIYIECIAPTKGDPKNSNSVPEMFIAKKPEEIRVQDVPTDKIILRITQAIKDKALDQYNEKWKNKKWFKEKSPFIIAINTGDLDWVQDYLGIPLIIKALSGLNFLQISPSGDESYSWRNNIQKGKGVPVNYFSICKFSFVSGVIFSDKRIIGNIDNNLGDDCIFVNNPFANNPVDPKFIDLFKNWTAQKNKTGIKLTKNYD